MVRQQAIQTLRNLTLSQQEYAPDAPQKVRKKGIDRWNTWWAEHAGGTVQSWMKSALESNSAKDRGRAALALGRSGDLSVVSSLLPLLKDPAGRVRQRSHRALIQLTGRDHQYDPDAKPEARKQSIQKWNSWWKRFKGHSPREWWHETIRTGSPSERSRAVRRLAESNARESIPWIVEALRDPSGGVRETSYHALRHLTGKDFGYDPDAHTVQREQSIQKALKWWSQQP
jgi:hypothetical protein